MIQDEEKREGLEACCDFFGCWLVIWRRSNSGYRFTFAKATQGVGFTDPNFGKNMNTVKSESCVEPIIYVNSNYANNYLDSSMSKYDLWIAHWRCDTDALQTANGWINCTQFIDANGRIYYDWIPSLMLWSWKKFLWPCFFFSNEKFNAITIIDTTKIEMVDDVGNLRQERR